MWRGYSKVVFRNDNYRDQGATRGEEGCVAGSDAGRYIVYLPRRTPAGWIYGVEETDLMLSKANLIMRAELGPDHPLWTHEGALIDIDRLGLRATTVVSLKASEDVECVG
jgi:hypothetical protein